MHWFDWLLLAIVLIILVLVIRYLKSHKGCHGSCCDGCSMKSCCDKRYKR